VFERLAAAGLRRWRRLRPRDLDNRAEAVEALLLDSPRLELAALGGRAEHRQRHLLAGLEGLQRWLDQDRPGRGPAWEHASDAAVRLIVWGLVAPRLGELLPSVAGSARAHLAFTLDHLEPDLSSPRALIQAAGLVVGGLAFPVQGAREAWSTGLSQLGRCLELQVLGDGSPAHGSSALLQRSVAAGLVARRFAQAARAPFPVGGDAALGRAAWFLRVLGHGGRLVLGEDPYESLLDESPADLWDAVVSLGLAPGEGAGGEPDRCALLGGLPAPGQGLGGKDWALWSFREGGLAVMHTRTGRVVMSERHGVRWTIGGDSVLRIGALPGTLVSARVDGRRATVAIEGPQGRRELRAEGGRLQIIERGVGGTAFDLDGLQLSEAPKGGWLGEGGGRTLKIDVEQGQLRAGRVEAFGAERRRASFELR
jgi:hypothetical protein